MIESEKQPAVLKRRKLSFKQWQQPNTALGQLGENRALNLLISKNYLIKDTNVLLKSGEIDIIAIDPQDHELVFCEVKTRTHTHFGHPSTAWNWKKKRAAISAASYYLKEHPTDLDIRFDLVVVTKTGITHYKNITS